VRRVLLPLLSSVLAAVVATVLSTAAPAWAHTRLVSSTPSAGASAEAPGEVVLVFSDPVQPTLSALSVTGPDGQEHVAGTPSPGGDGSSVSQALQGPLDAGTYRVAYRVLAADGHPITGSFAFTVAAPAVAPSAPAAAATPTATPTSAQTTGPVEATAGGDDEDGGLPVLPLAVGGLAVAGAAGLLARRFGGPPHQA
jgi:methionine-rich copper-binding protein CopC